MSRKEFKPEILHSPISGFDDFKSRDMSTSEFFKNRIWLVQDVAKFLDVSVGHIYNLTSRREIPFRKRGKRGRLYFIPSEILQWIDEGV